MALITIKEYAERHGLKPDALRQRVKRGALPTAQKIGRDWLMDEDAVITDARVKSGDYAGRYEKYGKKYYNAKKEADD